jgi:MFS-type transporter involved in bile tolerance (Atg22 family)
MNKKLLWIYILSASVYFTQGIEGLPGMALFAYLKETLHFDPSTIMYLGSITGLAWLIKPFWGYLIDNFLTKKTWITISLLGSLGICFYLGLSPFIPLGILIPILAFANWNTAMRDVANDAIMCVEGKELGECASIQSIQWIAITVASIVVGLLGGYIADHYSYQLGYLCLIPIYFVIMGIIYKYKGNRKEKCEEAYASYPYGCVKCEPNFLETIKSYKELFTNKQFLLGCLFLFVYKFAPGFGTPLSFIERDTFKWSFTFMSMLGAIASVISIIGAVIYYRINKKLM